MWKSEGESEDHMKRWGLLNTHLVWLAVVGLMWSGVWTTSWADEAKDSEQADHFFGVMLNYGTASLGLGGVNPVSLSLKNYRVEGALTVLKDHHELYVSIIPGIYYSWRSAAEGFYVTIGGGLSLNYYEQFRPALATGFGYVSCANFICFGIEYKNAVGYPYLLPLPVDTSVWSLRVSLGVIQKW